MEEFESLGDQLQGQVSVSFEDGPRGLLVELIGPRLLDREEFDDLVMVRVD